MTRRNLTSFVLTLVIITLGASVGSAGKIWMDPATLNLPNIGSTGAITVRIEGVDEVAGIELYITYNPKIVKVVSTPAPGVCPDPGFTVYNDFDNETGLVRYAVACLRGNICNSTTSPNQPAVSIEFERIGRGNADIKFSLDKKDAGISILAGNGVQIFDNSTPDRWNNAKVTAGTAEIGAASN